MTIAAVRSLRFSAGSVGIAAILFVVSNGGATLVLNRPEPAGAILVLSGDYYGRMPRAVELYRQGYGKQIIVDEDASRKFYGQTLADRRKTELAGDPSLKTNVCPILGATTSAESIDVANCLRDLNVKSVLIVTSDFHTRRALSIMEARMPSVHWSVAASKSDFDANNWWESPDSAEITTEEWMSFVYWKIFED